LYRTEFLKSAEPDLLEIKQILGRWAKRERRLGEVPVDEKEVIGVISSGEPMGIQKLRKEIRLMHDALSTETAYVGWVERFMKHVGRTQLENFGAPELKDFLTELVVEDGNSVGFCDWAADRELRLAATEIPRRCAAGYSSPGWQTPRDSQW